MKTKITALLLFASVLCLGQTYSPYYTGSKVTRAITADSVIVGARYENSVGGKAGLQMIISGDSSEVFQKSDTLFISASDFSSFLYNELIQFLQRDTTGGSGELFSTYFGNGIFGQGNVRILESPTDTSVIGFINLDNVFEAGSRFVGELYNLADTSGNSTVYFISPSQVGGSQTSSADWTALWRWAVRDWTTGGTVQPEVQAQINNSQASFADAYFAVLLMDENEVKLTQKDSLATATSVTQRYGRVVIEGGTRVKHTYNENAGFLPAAVHVQSTMKLDTVNCSDCYTSGFRVDHSLESPNDTFSQNSGSIYTLTDVDSSSVVPDFRDWYLTTMIKNGANVDFGKSVYITQDTANQSGDLPEQWAAIYLSQLRGSLSYGLYQDPTTSVPETSPTTKTYGLHLLHNNSDDYHNILNMLHLGSETGMSYTLDVNKSDSIPYGARIHGNSVIYNTDSSAVFAIDDTTVSLMDSGSVYRNGILLRNDGEGIDLSSTTNADGNTTELSVRPLVVQVTSDSSDAYFDIQVPAKAVNMTTASRDALTPAAGYFVFNTDEGVFNFYNGTAWQGIGQSANYGGMYIHANATATTINTVNVWEEVDGFTEGLNEGITYNTDEMIIETDGVYQCVFTYSTLSASANQTFDVALSVNGTIQNKCYTSRRYGSSDIGVGSGTCLLSVSASDTIRMEVRNITSSSNITFQEANINITVQ